MRLEKNKFNFNIWFIYLLLFYIIYTPQFYNSIIFDKYVLTPIIALALLIPYIIKKDTSIIKRFLEKENFIFTILIIFSTIYYFMIHTYINGFNLMESRLLQNTMPVFYMIIIFIIIDKLKKKGFSKDNMVSIIINLACVQGVICLVMMFIPEIKSIANYFYQISGNNNLFIINSRIYGIASDYTYATPIYHGFLASICLNLQFQKKGKYFLKILLIVLAVFLNGRTGLIMFIIGSLIGLFYYCVKNQKVFKFIQYLFILLIILVAFMFFLKKIAPSSYNFINILIRDTKDLIFEKNFQGNYSILKDSWFFPKGIYFVTGKGYRVYGEYAIVRNERFSDIGYVNDFYMGGLIYVVLLYTAYLYYNFKNFKNYTLKEKIIIINLFVLFCLSNFKGEAFRSTILIFLFIYLNLIKKESDKND